VTDNYLRHTSLTHNHLNLVFKYNIGKVKHFTSRKSNGIVKHIYDIENVALPSTKDISQFQSKGIKAFRIAQFSKKIVRVVIESRVKMKGKFKIKGKKLVLFLPSSREVLKVKPEPIKRATKNTKKV